MIFIPVIATYPVSNLLSGKDSIWGLWIFLMTNLGLRGISSTNIYTPVMIFINNSVPKQFMGRANGVSQAFAAGMRTVGPPLAGFLWSVTSEASYPLHTWTVFFLWASFSAVILILTRVYSPGIHLSYADRQKEQEGEVEASPNLTQEDGTP